MRVGEEREKELEPGSRKEGGDESQDRDSKGTVKTDA